MSVDCEGEDFNILNAFPFEIVKPKVILVEDFKRNGYSKIDKILQEKGYVLKATALITKLFTLAQF